MGTSIERTSNVVDIYKLADAYEMPADTIDGMTPEAVHEGISRAVNRAREKGGPTLIEIKTYRYKGHSMSDAQTYRSKEEVKEYQQHDPIDKVILTLKKNNWINDAEIEAMEEKIKTIVNESVAFAEESPYPEPEELYKDVYVEENYPFIIE